MVASLFVLVVAQLLTASFSNSGCYCAQPPNESQCITLEQLLEEFDSLSDEGPAKSVPGPDHLQPVCLGAGNKHQCNLNSVTSEICLTADTNAISSFTTLNQQRNCNIVATSPSATSGNEVVQTTAACTPAVPSFLQSGDSEIEDRPPQESKIAGTENSKRQRSEPNGLSSKSSKRHTKKPQKAKKSSSAPQLQMEPVTADSPIDVDEEIVPGLIPIVNDCLKYADSMSDPLAASLYSDVKKSIAATLQSYHADKETWTNSDNQSLQFSTLSSQILLLRLALLLRVANQKHDYIFSSRIQSYMTANCIPLRQKAMTFFDLASHETRYNFLLYLLMFYIVGLPQEELVSLILTNTEQKSAADFAQFYQAAQNLPQPARTFCLDAFRIAAVRYDNNLYLSALLESEDTASTKELLALQLFAIAVESHLSDKFSFIFDFITTQSMQITAIKAASRAIVGTGCKACEEKLYLKLLNKFTVMSLPALYSLTALDLTLPRYVTNALDTTPGHATMSLQCGLPITDIAEVKSYIESNVTHMLQKKLQASSLRTCGAVIDMLRYAAALEAHESLIVIVTEFIGTCKAVVKEELARMCAASQRHGTRFTKCSRCKRPLLHWLDAIDKTNSTLAKEIRDIAATRYHTSDRIA